ncbi:MAG: ABC transporter permease, partial [Anaerolineales bacterium]|nr:ABC transporter permease [Anaerolineales bacterium]
MATTTLRQEVEVYSPTRKWVMGFLFLVIGAAIYFIFALQADADAVTTFVMTPGGVEASLPDWILPSRLVLIILAVVAGALGVSQLVLPRGFGSRTTFVLFLVAGFFIFAFLVWSAADNSLNLAGLLNSTLSKAVPLTLGALSGVLCERAGVVNIAIEGMMLAAAMVGALIGSVTGDIWIGLGAGVAAGALLGLGHAVLSVTYMTNQIISGTVINIFAVGITSYISAKFMQPYQHLNNPAIFQPWEIPLLSKIPFVGPILFINNFFVYAMFFFLIVLHVGLFYTRWGLRLRSVGEHPKAADT